MPRDHRGWRVAPAPDGRGAPEPPGPAAASFSLVCLVRGWAAGVQPGVGVPVLAWRPAAGEGAVQPVFPVRGAVRPGGVDRLQGRHDPGNLQVAGALSRHRREGTPTTLFATQVPSFWNNDQLTALLGSEGVQVNAQSTTQTTPLIVSVLLGFGPTLLIVGLFVLFARRAAKSGGMGALGNFGRSKARRIDPATIRITFADVAGIDEAKSELTEIVDFLRNPARYGRLGGRMPHGVLLSGAPGTGKTLLARAVAGEAHAAFFSISASEFIEAIVGVGASRVRDLFAKAKEAAPSIIFIDELDAIGRSRQGSVSIAGSNDEREQTLNQILTEMDGFESVEAVVVLAATNRGEILDPALLRPGRFDRRVAVQPPDRVGRRQILEVHTRSIPLAASVDLEALAATTPGMVGADLANLANEAALLAARRNHHTVQTSDFTDSLEKILLGAPRGIVLSTADRERTAYHEAGHALIGMLTPGADPCARSRSSPAAPRSASRSRRPMTTRSPTPGRTCSPRSRWRSAAGWRRRRCSARSRTGAESDIDQVTTIARQMVGRWGMSEAIGFVRVLPADGRGSFFGSSGESSEATQRVLDEEVRQLIDTAHRDVTAALTEHRDRLETLAHALLKNETLDELDAYAAAQMPPRNPDAGGVRKPPRRW